MSNIIAVIPAVSAYRNQLSYEYNGINNVSSVQYQEITRWLNEIFTKIETVSTFISSVTNLLSQVQVLIGKFQQKIYEAEERAKAIYDAGEWITTYDNEGHITGRYYRYDEAAYQAAKAEADQYRNKLNQAKAIESEINEVLGWLKNVQHELQNCADDLSLIIHQYGKIKDEIAYISQTNLQLLAKIISALNAYASCTNFISLTGTFTYSSSGSSSDSVASSFSTSSLAKTLSRILEKDSVIFHSPVRDIDEKISEKSRTSTSPFSSQSEMPSSSGCRGNSIEDCSDSGNGNGSGNLDNTTVKYRNSSTQKQILFGDDAFSDIETIEESIANYNQRSIKDQKNVGDVSSLVDYTKEAHWDINKVLTGEADSNLNFSQRRKEIANEKALSISEAIMKTQLDRPMLVYRGQSIRPILRDLGYNDEFRDYSIAKLQEILPGSEYRSSGFLSTTIDKNTAIEFGSHAGGVLLEIEVPKGAHAIHLGTISDRGVNRDASIREHEILLQKSTSYKIKSIERFGEKGEMYLMKVRVVSQEKMGEENHENCSSQINKSKVFDNGKDFCF